MTPIRLQTIPTLHLRFYSLHFVGRYIPLRICSDFEHIFSSSSGTVCTAKMVLWRCVVCTHTKEEEKKSPSIWWELFNISSSLWFVCERISLNKFRLTKFRKIVFSRKFRNIADSVALYSLSMSQLINQMCSFVFDTNTRISTLLVMCVCVRACENLTACRWWRVGVCNECKAIEFVSCRFRPVRVRVSLCVCVCVRASFIVRTVKTENITSFDFRLR